MDQDYFVFYVAFRFEIDIEDVKVTELFISFHEKTNHLFKSTCVQKIGSRYAFKARVEDLEMEVSGEDLFILQFYNYYF